MTPPLFLLAPLPDADAFRLDGAEGRHAARVRRLTVGEVVLVTDGAGAVLDCTVTEVLSDGLLLAVTQRRTEPVPDPRLVVVQALPKGERAELAVELLTELGVDEIVPWSAARCVPRWDDARAARALERWRRTAQEAAKQSRRLRLPVVAPLASTTDVARRLSDAVGVVLHEDADRPLTDLALPASGDVLVVVGPEGGISAEELDEFAALGAHAVRLGAPVLRTSTAGAAALAVLSVRLGRWT